MNMGWPVFASSRSAPLYGDGRRNVSGNVTDILKDAQQPTAEACAQTALPQSRRLARSMTVAFSSDWEGIYGEVTDFRRDEAENAGNKTSQAQFTRDVPRFPKVRSASPGTKRRGQKSWTGGQYKWRKQAALTQALHHLIAAAVVERTAQDGIRCGEIATVATEFLCTATVTHTIARSLRGPRPPLTR